MVALSVSFDLSHILDLPYFLIMLKAIYRLRIIVRFRDPDIPFLNFSILTEKIINLSVRHSF
jgi:hypothetical protein